MEQMVFGLSHIKSTFCKIIINIQETNLAAARRQLLIWLSGLLLIRANKRAPAIHDHRDPSFFVHPFKPLALHPTMLGLVTAADTHHKLMHAEGVLLCERMNATQLARSHDVTSSR